MSSLVLGIESSCDDTSVALVAEDGMVVACSSASQIDLHAVYGGVVPEIASRAHLETIGPLISSVLLEGGIEGRDLRGIAVTRGPGLVGALLVGVATAKSLGLAWGVPVVGVNHLEGHLFSVGLDAKPLEYPMLILLVSGGHCFLAHAIQPGSYEILGSTLDDSVGEAYDKVARLMGLGYPGGPVLDRMAKEGTDNCDFPRPIIDHGLDFSFSGLKTAVQRYLVANPNYHTEDVAASFAAASMDVLVEKVTRAARQVQPRCVAAVGGVSASPILRSRLADRCDDLGCELFLPPLKYATDNGAMIAAVGWWQLENVGPSAMNFGATPNLPLGKR